MADLGMTRVRIDLFQHALAHPEASSERFESIEAKLDELRSYANRDQSGGTPKRTGTESVFRSPMWSAPSINCNCRMGTGKNLEVHAATACSGDESVGDHPV